MSDMLPMSDNTRQRMAETAASAGPEATLRSSFARTEAGVTVVEFEWRNGPWDGERFSAVFTPDLWRQFVNAINEADAEL